MITAMLYCAWHYITICNTYTYLHIHFARKLIFESSSKLKYWLLDPDTDSSAQIPMHGNLPDKQKKNKR